MAAKKLTARDRQRLERALCTLADFEWAIKIAGAGQTSRGGDFDYGFHDVCRAVEALADGEIDPAKGSVA